MKRPLELSDFSVIDLDLVKCTYIQYYQKEVTPRKYRWFRDDIKPTYKREPEYCMRYDDQWGVNIDAVRDYLLIGNALIKGQ